jgi:hypothetical protein
MQFSISICCSFHQIELHTRHHNISSSDHQDLLHHSTKRTKYKMKHQFSDRIANPVNDDLQDTIWRPPLFETAAGHFIEQVARTPQKVALLGETRALFAGTPGIRHELFHIEVQGTESATTNRAHQSTQELNRWGTKG